MSSLIKHLEIKNFKSVRTASLDCARINLFLGKPNAGKSNLLEAVSLLGAGYSEGRFMKGLVRYEKTAQLFHNFDLSEKIEIVADEVCAVLSGEGTAQEFQFSVGYTKKALDKALVDWDGPDRPTTSMIPFVKFNLDQNGKLGIGVDEEKEAKSSKASPVKKYDFAPLAEYRQNGMFLHPPHGDNFYIVARTNKELRAEIRDFLKPNGFKLLLEEGSQRVMLMQEKEDSFLSFPMHLVPDTFQRYFFHLAAVLSNKHSVLLFEEPETHSYAPSVHDLAQHIAADDRGNQYFITTHNPYFLTPILQEADDLAVFITWFEDYQTHVRRLSQTEVDEVVMNGIDVFLTLHYFAHA